VSMTEGLDEECLEKDRQHLVLALKVETGR
jgi:hypothetical protein